MRRIRCYSWLFVLAMVLMMLSSTAAQAQSAKTAWSTDLFSGEPDTLMDIWRMDENGDNEEQLTDELGDAKRPSITLNGSKTVYDHDGDLWIMDSDGTGEVKLALAIGEDDPCEEAYGMGATCELEDIAAGLHIGGPRVDFRVVFTVELEDEPDSGELFTATVDVSASRLTDVVQFTDTYHPTDTSVNKVNYQAAFCGSNKIVWSRSQLIIPIASGLYFWDLCILEFDDPLDEPTCYALDLFGTTDESVNQYPNCNLAGTTVA